MKKNTLNIIARSRLIIGILLLAVNMTGFFLYTAIKDTNEHILDDHRRTISEQEFWEQAYINKNEDLAKYTRRLTALISNRIIYIDPKHAKPTFFENYILWIYSTYKNSYEWKNTRKAIRLGGGFCSQHALIFDNILKEQEIESRIIGLTGHVINEVLIDGEWEAYDPDYNVVFNKSIKELEADPKQVYAIYTKAGRPESEARHWQKVFGSKSNNENYRSAFHYTPLGYLIETLSFYLIWIFPSLLIFSAYYFRTRPATTTNLSIQEK